MGRENFRVFPLRLVFSLPLAAVFPRQFCWLAINPPPSNKKICVATLLQQVHANHVFQAALRMKLARQEVAPCPVAI